MIDKDLNPQGRKGIVLAGGSGTRLYPLTKVVSKQLMPIYDKPMIFYPISILMRTGITEIAIISTPEEIHRYKNLLGDGSAWGISFEYIVQPSPDGLAQAFILAETFLAGKSASLILGDNIFYGHDLITSLRNANQKEHGATVFGYHVSNPSAYGVVEFNKERTVVSIEEKPQNPKSNYAVPGLYFFDENVVRYAKNVQPSKRGELEITDVMEQYMQQKTLTVEVMGRGTAWLDTGTLDDLLDAALFIRTIEKRQGLKISCPEEIAYNMNYISAEQLKTLAEPLVKSGYGRYLLNLLKDDL